MPFMLKIQWEIKAGREADFRANQAALRKVMLEHPGVICYHAYYPSERVSQWTEIYATDEAFAAHLANDKGKGRWPQPLTRATRLPVNAGEPKRRFQRAPRRFWADAPRHGHKRFCPQSQGR